MLSKRLINFDSSALRDAFHKQSALTNPVDLGVGEPEELTNDHIKAGAIDAIRKNFTRYTPVNGIPELRDALVHKLQTENQIESNPEAITVVPGITTGLLLVYLAVLDPEDEIVIFDPYYPPYKQLAEMLGARIINVSTLPSFQPDIPAIEAAITNKTKAMVINSPNNPTGAVYPEKTLRKLAEIADKHNILIISDEIYEYFTYDISHFSIGSIYKNTVTLNGFSKAYAMTGWRLGYLTGPAEIIDAVNELQQYVVFASSSISQKAALAAIQQKINIASKYKKKRDLAKDTLGQKVKINGAQGSYYMFFKAPDDLTDLELVDKAANHNLILLPGRAFSDRHGYIRLSYGSDIKTLQKGLDILTKILDA